MFQRFVVIVFAFMLISCSCFCQNLTAQLSIAIEKLSKDGQFKHAIISLYVVDEKTGNVIFDKNSQLGLAPASCQKIVTSATAFELLGKDFQYKTYVDCEPRIDNGILQGNLFVTGNGDPTLGSDRWKTTSEEMILKQVLSILRKNKIRSVKGDLVCDDSRFTTDPIPGGWVWEDIGNYYGAGAWGLNWRENQFDITFKTGKVLNDATEIISTSPAAVLREYTFANFVKTGARGSGDNAYLFSSPFHKNIMATGTVPLSVNNFTISGSMPDPPGIFMKRVKEYLNENGISVSGDTWSYSNHLVNNTKIQRPPLIHLDSILSPFLDSINYWFLKKSVNLFGEAFVKIIANEKTSPGSTDTGIAIIKNFWNKHGIDLSSLKIIDGSGLSPANRATTHALVTVLQYAKSRPWFSSFYNALPESNGIKMKDGYITGVRSYTGYIKSKNGGGYTFAFIVNNFDGSGGSVREKMWKVLDVLKN